MEYHRSVMLSECVEQLAIGPTQNYVDATLGGGGHTLEIANQLTTGHLFSFDQDIDAIQHFVGHPNVTVIQTNFSCIKPALAKLNVSSVAGIFADLGISSHQIDIPERGFSFRFPGPLDMRMSHNQTQTAAGILNEYPAEKLASILWENGNVTNNRKIARLIADYRQYKTFQTTQDLLQAIQPVTPKYHEYKFLAPIFQAIRIEVNQEMEHLRLFLEQSLELLEVGGRLAILTYHSIEDRLVKRFMRGSNQDGSTNQDIWGNKLAPFELLTHKALVPSQEEIESNPRARSAKLRVARKL